MIRAFSISSLSDGYGHTSVPIFMTFETNTLGTKAERSMCMDISISLLFQNIFRFVCIFHGKNQTLWPIFMKFGMSILGTKVKRRMCKDCLICVLLQNGGRFVDHFAVIVKHLDRSSFNSDCLDIYIKPYD